MKTILLVFKNSAIKGSLGLWFNGKTILSLKGKKLDILHAPSEAWDLEKWQVIQLLQSSSEPDR